MIKEDILNFVKIAINKAITAKKLGELSDINDIKVMVENPKNPEFGDFAVNVSSLARYAKLPPVKIAEIITEYIKLEDVEMTNIAGFINFKLGNSFLIKIISDILKNPESYGKLAKNDEKILLEYVSANPTGPFHIGHGRWAAMGSALANILKYTGCNVYQEFYINDAGSQIDNLARSFYLRILQQIGIDIDFPKSEEELKKYYPNEYLVPIAKDFLKKYPNFYAENNKSLSYDKLEKVAKDTLKDYAKKYIMGMQRDLLKKINVSFDNFYSETSLYTNKLVEKAVVSLKEKGVTYEQDGALWFRTTDFNDEKDRVLIKHDGSYTYLTPDIAYHLNKLERGFTKLINIWGADHHGYVCRMKAALSALGYNAEALEVLLGQLVNLKIDGEAVRMGKRKKMLTLEDLVDEVGVDATRFWMTFRNIDTTLDFDVELAKSKTDENPVFYVQYAHARSCSILRNATTDLIDSVNNVIKAPHFNEKELQSYFDTISSNDLSLIFKDVNANLATQKALLLKLEGFKNIIKISADMRAPYILCQYLQDLAAIFHQFYTTTRVISDDIKLTKARLALVFAFKSVLKTGLTLIGVSAPERM